VAGVECVRRVGLIQEMVVFMIVGKSEPLYEAELGVTGKDELAYLHQFILHSSLDMVENNMWGNNATLESFSS
jgi:hypothetical protein